MPKKPKPEENIFSELVEAIMADRDRALPAWDALNEVVPTDTSVVEHSEAAAPTLEFEIGAGSEIASHELAQFLHLLGIACSLSDPHETLNDFKRIVEEMWHYPHHGKARLEQLRQLRDFIRERVDCGDSCYGYRSLSILRLRFESPIEIVMAGSMALLAVATVISGGQIQISKTGLRVRVPSLGSGIKTLREALKSDVAARKRKQ